MLADEEVCVWTAPAAILGDLDRVCRNPCQGWFPSSFDLPFRRAQHSCRIAARFSVVAHSRSPGHRRVFPSRFHYPAPALIQVGARVGRLHLVTDRVPQRRLRQLPRVPAFGAPVAERRPEPVRVGGTPNWLSSSRKAPSGSAPPRGDRNTKPSPPIPTSRKTASARADSGTR